MNEFPHAEMFSGHSSGLFMLSRNCLLSLDQTFDIFESGWGQGGEPGGV